MACEQEEHSGDLERAFDDAFEDDDWDQTAAEAADDTAVSDRNALSGSELAAQAEDEAADLTTLHNAVKQAAYSDPLLLHLMPREILLRVLAMVPAEGLLAVAQTCRVMRSAALEDALWRRLYCARWGKPSSVRANMHWRVSYMDRDGEEWSATVSRCGEGGEPAKDPFVAPFLDMLRAKRGTGLSRREVDDPCEVEGDIAAKLAAWRRARGFANPSAIAGAPSAPHHHARAPPPRAEGCAGGSGAAGASTSCGSHHTAADADADGEELPAGAAEGAEEEGAEAHGGACALREAAPPGAGGSCVGSSGKCAASCAGSPGTGPRRPAAARGGAAAALGSPQGPTARAAAGPVRGPGQAAPPAGGGGTGASRRLVGAAAAVGAEPPRPDLSARGRAALSFTRVNPGQLPPVYACDQSGWVHVCGDACTEGVVDPSCGDLVCPVSGQTSERLVHECEEREGEAEGERGAGCAPEEELGGVFTGGIGSFFVAGYECENERALQRLLCSYGRKRM